jgi:hypothetical protein
MLNIVTADIAMKLIPTAKPAITGIVIVDDNGLSLLGADAAKTVVFYSKPP